MTVSDAERQFYEEVLAGVLSDPRQYSINDLRYAYFLAALDGSLPGGSGTVQSVVQGSHVTVDSTDPANPVVSANVPDNIVVSDGSVAGLLHRNTMGELPATGTTAWFYLVG